MRYIVMLDGVVLTAATLMLNTAEAQGNPPGGPPAVPCLPGSTDPRCPPGTDGSKPTHPPPGTMLLLVVVLTVLIFATLLGVFLGRLGKIIEENTRALQANTAALGRVESVSSAAPR